MKKILLTIVALAIVAGSVYGYFALRTTAPKYTVSTAAVTRGDVVETVGATGTLQAVTTVQVGTQVSGTIQSLYADYNSLVKKGQVLARLDPSLFQTQIEQARANLIRSEADRDRLRVTLEDAQTKLARARELSSRQLLPRSELDAAEVAVRSAQAQLQSQEAQVTQSRASLSQNDVNLQHTIIEAPIDGLVISRSVDVGQTVAASMQAPVLFVLAADLTKMQVIANLDESDVGRIRPGQPVTFRVDAYATETFTGAVSQVRLEPKVQQNVVTYATVIDVPNAALKLKPGMTANVSIEIARGNNVLRVPNSALRFRPTSEMYASIGQTPPDPASVGANASRRANGPSGTGATQATDQSPLAPPGSAVGIGAASPPGSHADGPSAATAGRRQSPNGTNGSDSGQSSERGDLAARLERMTPEQRQRVTERMRQRGADAAPPGAAAVPRKGASAASAGNGGATTIDALFGPLPREESVGRVWTFTNGQLTPIRLRLGISDGQVSEVLQGDVQERQDLVTNFSTGTATTRPPATNAFPFGPQQGRGAGGFGGGNFGGGGANRGGGRQ